jgi:hypothetical protein
MEDLLDRIGPESGSECQQEKVQSGRETEQAKEAFQMDRGIHSRIPVRSAS